MKKIYLLLLLFISVQSGFAQEKLISILDSLEVKGKSINPQYEKADRLPPYFILEPMEDGEAKYDYENGNCFGYMRKNQNFHYANENLAAIYINSYMNYSIYLLVQEDLFSKEKFEDYYSYIGSDIGKMALLFDKGKNICYALKYGGAWVYNRFFLHYENKDTVTIQANFARGISSIVRLNNIMEPMYGTKINVEISKIRKKYEFDALYEFGGLFRKYRRLQIPPISVNEITEEELAKLFSDKHGYNIYLDSDKIFIDNELLFSIGIDGF